MNDRSALLDRPFVQPWADQVSDRYVAESVSSAAATEGQETLLM